jgi:hypothetical protein
LRASAAANSFIPKEKDFLVEAAHAFHPNRRGDIPAVPMVTPGISGNRGGALATPAPRCSSLPSKVLRSTLSKVL